MYTRQVKRGVFVLEGINSLVSTYYFYYVYFFMAKEFGFDTMKNLLLAAGLGLVYAVSSMFGGKFAQKHGYFTALKTGFAILTVALGCGIVVRELWLHLLLISVSTFGICFTWPTLEALISENEPRRRLSRMVGIYNLVWAACGAFAYFTGGALLGTFGGKGIFVVPALLSA
ncbi:MAG TPA: MFS transporter, partial [Roseimicrobium sp.]|nr:MFS transporter [Roseimicrobium sp.]